MTATTDHIEFTTLAGDAGDLGMIFLNRPQALNALSYAMIQSLSENLQAWRQDKNIKAVVIQSRSEKAFCAGGDIRQLYQARNHTEYNLADFFADEYRLNHLIYHYPKPYISILDGITMGGGVGISLHGSHPIATEHLKIAMPESTIGFFPDIGGAYWLARCHGGIGMYLALTGNSINYQNALYAGLIRNFLAQSQIIDFIAALQATAFDVDPESSVTTILADVASTKPDLENCDLAKQRQMIDACFEKSSLAEILAALHNGGTEWHQQTLKTLQTKSPTSLKVIFQQIQRAKYLDLDDVLQMDYRLVNRFIGDHDFFEGVRALLIDKDNQPNWQPKTIEEVDDQHIKQYFALLDPTFRTKLVFDAE